MPIKGQPIYDIHLRAICRMAAGHFTAETLAEDIGIHINTAYRLIKEGRDQGIVHFVGWGKRRPGVKTGGEPYLYELRNPFVKSPREEVGQKS